MAPEASTWRSPDDQDFLDNVITRDLKCFRNSIFPKEFIESHPTIFLDSEWVDIPKLKAFLTGFSSDGNANQPTPSQNVKAEPSETVTLQMKTEPPELDVAEIRLGGWAKGDRLRTRQLEEDGHEIIEILSDSDSDAGAGNHGVEDRLGEVIGDDSSGWESEAYLTTESLPPLSDAEGFGSEFSGANDDEDSDNSDSEKDFDPSVFVIPSNTVWDDPDFTSTVLVQEARITTSLTVQRLEYLTEIPSLWPIPQEPTAFVLNLHDPKFQIYDKEGKLFSPDALIKNKDQDSWRGGTGTADSTAQVVFAPGTRSITCRRSRLTCQGCHICIEVDSDLVDIARHELEPSSRDKIFEAQRKTRQEDGNSLVKRTVTFFHVIQSRPQCDAHDNVGKQCKGRPMMKEQATNSTGSHRYWIACSGWTSTFKMHHRTMSIPDDVDEDVLAKLMAGKAISEDLELDTPPCSRVVPPHIGGKLKQCPHPHIVNGTTLARAPIKHRRCPAQRTIYVPVDPGLRIALVAHPKMIPHNHPMPPKSKVSIEAKGMYKGLINAAATIGATVQKVDNSPSTKLLLGGKSPGEHNPALQDKRVKRSILREVKLDRHPSGLGLPGVMYLHMEDLKKPMEERYIHKIVTSDDGGVLVFTFIPFLLGLIHKEEVTSFECDVTFKRALELNEWEMVIYLPSIQRSEHYIAFCPSKLKSLVMFAAVTTARVYTNRATTEHFVLLFNELQRLTELHTGHKIRFKRFTPGGNLLVMNADMEAAQILAAGIAFLPMNKLEYSKIDTQVPEEFVQYFVRVCLTHGKRAVLDFKSLVSAQDFQRLINFPYLKSQEDLDDFTCFVKDLKIKKIHDWWMHKIQSKWIIPCILKSKSRILPEHWDITPATTNMGEAQHHWTNKQSGIKLPIVEAILSAEEIDKRVCGEVKSAYDTGILGNKQTELFHRTSRKAQRHSATARKARDATKLHAVNQDLRSQIDEEKAKRKESTQRQRKLQEELSASNSSKCPKPSRHGLNASQLSHADASSSGRVKSTPRQGNCGPDLDTTIGEPEFDSDDSESYSFDTPNVSIDTPGVSCPRTDHSSFSSFAPAKAAAATDNSVSMSELPLQPQLPPHPFNHLFTDAVPLSLFDQANTYPFAHSNPATLNDNSGVLMASLLEANDQFHFDFGFENFDIPESNPHLNAPLSFDGLRNLAKYQVGGASGDVSGTGISNEVDSDSYGLLDEYGIPIRFLPAPAPYSSPPVAPPSPQLSAPRAAEDETKKRPRDEVDVRAILPEGSKRVKVKSVRARETWL
ncbi:hypothetical protein DXG01_005156 [Tephrocybe rancida]|nr:hypothetical protein DXG01_005156 [Tephrocybe rancida]